MKARKKLSKKSTAFQICHSITEVEKKEYDSIQPDNNPFFEFDFLFALEKSGCVGPGTGWEPRHLLLREGKKLVGAVTFYLKTDSYGEYIFDWQWARAYQDAGLRYYPKAVAGVPFTPTTGPRIIVREDYDYETCAQTLVKKLVEICSLKGLSSIHFLFITALRSRNCFPAAASYRGSPTSTTGITRAISVSMTFSGAFAREKENR